MKYLFSGPSVFAILWMIVSGCSFPGISETDAVCPELKVAFAGAAHPFVCAGDTVPVRVTMANSTANVTFSITSTDGMLTSLSQQGGVWQFSSDRTPGTTRFNVYIDAVCGWRSEQFDVVTVACPDTASETETVGHIDTESGTSGDYGSDGDTSVALPINPPVIDYDGPRHVILFVGDGMGHQSEIGLSRYLTGTDDSLAFHRFSYGNYMTTWDVNTYNRHASDMLEADDAYDTDDTDGTDDSNRLDEVRFDPENVVPQRGYDPAIGGDQMIRGDDASRAYVLKSATDSGAAATALATGQKTAKGNISWEADDLPDGEITTIVEQSQERGMRTGVVSTVAFSHATPAAFVSHNVNRGNYHEIAREIIFKTSPDVVISAGSPAKLGSYSALSEAEYNWLKSTTTRVFTEWAEGIDGGDSLLDAVSDAVTMDVPLFGLFGTSVIPMPRPVHSPGSPMFDGAPLEEPSLAEATMAAVTVLSQGDSGFFLMVEGGTIDKGNHANDYEWMLGSMWDFERAVAAAVDWVNEDGDDFTMENTLIIVTTDHANGYITYDEGNPLGQGELPQANDEVPRVTYGSGGHTNEPVRVYATGAGIAGGAERLFEPYEYIQYPELPIIDNTHVYDAMAHFIGVGAE